MLLCTATVAALADNESTHSIVAGLAAASVRGAGMLTATSAGDNAPRLVPSASRCAADSAASSMAAPGIIA